MNATALLRCGKCGARENRAASRHSRRVHSAVETRGPSPGNSTSHEPWVRLGTVPREKDFSKAWELEAHKRDTTPNTIFDWSTRVGAKRREQTRDPKRGLSQSIQIGSPVSISRCALKNPCRLAVETRLRVRVRFQATCFFPFKRVTAKPLITPRSLSVVVRVSHHDARLTRR